MRAIVICENYSFTELDDELLKSALNGKKRAYQNRI